MVLKSKHKNRELTGFGGKVKYRTPRFLTDGGSTFFPGSPGTDAMHAIALVREPEQPREEAEHGSVGRRLEVEENYVDALLRTETLRWLIVKLATELLTHPEVSMPTEMRDELAMLVRAEGEAKRMSVLLNNNSVAPGGVDAFQR